MNDLIDTTEMYLRTIYELEEEGVVPLRARIAERLGQSGPTVSQTRLDAPRTDTSVGLPIPGVEVRIVARDGLDVAQGEAGELWIRSPGRMRGYYRDPAAAHCPPPAGSTWNVTNGLRIGWQP